MEAWAQHTAVDAHLPRTGIALLGFEHPSVSKQNTQNPPGDSAPDSAFGPKTVPTDPDLSALVAAWPTIPPALRAGIVAMVKAAGAAGGAR